MDKNELKIMEYLDGESTDPGTEVRREADSLQNSIDLLRSEPLEAVPGETDRRLLASLEDLKLKKSRNDRILTFVASIAALFILFYGFYPRVTDQVKIDMDASIADVDKLNYFHSLYNKKLDDQDIADLNELLASEVNPNVKVIILDLIDEYSVQNQVTPGLLENLDSEDPPSVQMALLNILDSAESNDYIEKLQAFSTEPGLERTVIEKVRTLLGQTGPPNLNN